MDDEMLDIVDGHDNAIGTINRKNYDRLVTDDLGYIRAAEMFIINDQGKLWVPVRTADKTIAPSGYDFSAAGHVEAGSNYVETIIREAKEEINLDLTESDLEFVSKRRYPKTRYIIEFYVVRSNVTPGFNPSDFTHANWMTPEELLESIASGHSTKSDVVEITSMLKFYLA